MKVLVFEWISGGGCQLDGIPVTSLVEDWASMLKQGQGMLASVVEDFARAGHQPLWLWDSRLTRPQLPGSSIALDSANSLQAKLLEVGQDCDAILLIAPESGGRLAKVCQWLNGLADRLISPDLTFINLTSNKQQTCQWLSAQGVPVPWGCLLSDSDLRNRVSTLSFPMVLKPVDGAGSEQVRLIHSFDEVQAEEFSADFRIEEFVTGRPLSVSVLCDGNQHLLLPVTQQVFAAEPWGHYVTALHPVPEPIAQKAAQLALQAIRALPPTRGYVGIDLVVSNEPSQTGAVIEINPRLTMSYLKLRQICDFNIAARMLMSLKNE